MASVEPDDFGEGWDIPAATDGEPPSEAAVDPDAQALEEASDADFYAAAEAERMEAEAALVLEAEALEPEYEVEPPFAADEPTPSPAPTREASLSDSVLEALRTVLAAQQSRPWLDLAAMVREVQAAPKVLAHLPGEYADIYVGVLELLLDTALSIEGGSVDLSQLPYVYAYDEDVKAEIALIGTRALAGYKGPHPHQVWFATKELVQRKSARKAASTFVTAIDARAPVEQLMERYHELEAPTTRRADTKSKRTTTRTANQVIADDRQSKAGRGQIAFSSGFPSLDLALTRKGDPLGSFTPGTGTVVGGATGTGKSSFSYAVLCALGQDMVDWGLKDAKILFAHTEEESIDKIESAKLGEGQPFHHLADNIVVVNIGTSRRGLAEMIYDSVIEAFELATATGRPIDQFLPYVLVLDYLQSLSEIGEGTEAHSTEITADFLLRGVQAWNPEEMAKFSGVSFQEYAGMPWPDGMAHHRVAGIYFAQLLIKGTEAGEYKAASRTASHLTDFTLEDTSGKPGWRGPEGNGGWSWEVKEGDARIPRQKDIRGSGLIMHHATNIILLHRSRPYQKDTYVGDDGLVHLVDTRARLIIDKARYGIQKMNYVRMSFDLQPSGRATQYYDPIGEDAYRQGYFSVAGYFTRSGDPLLPERPQRSPFYGLRY